MKRYLLYLLMAFATSGVFAAEINSSEEVYFTFQRGGMSGWTTAWSGVVVKVKGNTVTPTFALLKGVFSFKFHHNKTLAIQACKKN